MLLQLTKLQERFQKLEEVSLEHQIMMLWVHKLDLSIVHKDKFKREKKWFTLLLSMKSMLSIRDLKDFWHFSQVLLVKSLRKSENRLIRELQNGEKKERLK